MKNVIFLFPGSFCPYTDGHYSILERFEDEYIKKANNNFFKVIIYKSSKSRENLSPDYTLSLIENIYSNDDRVDVNESHSGNPIKDCYDKVLSDTSGKNVYIFVSSSKDDDNRDSDFKDYFAKKNLSDRVYDFDINIKPVIYKDRNDKFNGKIISSSVARNDIRDNDFKKFITNYRIILKKQPSISDKVLKLYFNKFKNEISTVQDKKSQEKIHKLL